MVTIALEDGGDPAKIAEAFEVSEFAVRRIASLESQRRAKEMTARRKSKKPSNAFGDFASSWGFTSVVDAEPPRPRAIVKGKELDFKQRTYADAINDHLKEIKND